MSDDTPTLGTRNDMEFCNFIYNPTPTALIVAEGSGFTLNIKYCLLYASPDCFIFDTNGYAYIYAFDSRYDCTNGCFSYADNQISTSNMTLTYFFTHYQFSYYATHDCLAEVPYPRMKAHSYFGHYVRFPRKLYMF